MGQGHQRVMIGVNFVELHFLMLHAKFQNYRPSGSGEEFLRFLLFIVMADIWTIYTNVRFPFLRMLHTNSGFDWPSVFKGEDV